MISFLDDINMPVRDNYGSQPPLELIRLWNDYGYWYDRAKQWRKNVKVPELVTRSTIDLQILTAGKASETLPMNIQLLISYIMSYCASRSAIFCLQPPKIFNMFTDFDDSCLLNIIVIL